MIENNRNEEVFRRWDVLADENLTYHQSEEEYFHYKNKWWLHLNKSDSDTLPLRKRSDFKQALSTLERLHQEAGEEQLAPTLYWKNKQWKAASSSSSTWWEWQDPSGLLHIQKVKEEASKVLGENGETRCLQYFDENLRRWLS